MPKKQLLVWDMEEDPRWEALTEFLGRPLPDPSAPFPKVDRLAY